MYLMKTGHMIVRSHEKKEDVLIHPLGIKKFVTFSSWTLILNVMYFFFATIGSFFLLAGTNLPSNLAQLLAGVFVTALGASFLTSTVVRYVILPGNYSDEEHHKRQFWFHNQMMHNFCTIFLVVNILLTSPQLEFVYMLFGILIGLAYALFAFPFAAFGGGYYCYSFIDPRLPKGEVDLVFCVDVYHEFSHPEKMLKRIRESLSDNGQIVLAEFRGEDASVPIKPLHKMTKLQVKKELEPNGFVLEREFDELPWQHLMFFGVQNKE